MMIHRNIKFLRQRKAVTQAEASAAMKLSRSQLAGYERTIRPTLDALLAISYYFCISTDAILKVDLVTLTDFKLRELIQGNDSFISGNKLRVLAVTVDSAGADQVEVVPVKARAGYLNSYADPEYMSELSVVSLPFISKTRKHRMFQLEGDSMLPMQSKSYVVCSYVDDWHGLVEGRKYILLTQEDGIVFKLVFFRSTDKSVLLLCSTNTAYKPFELRMADIIEIWQFESHLTEPLYA